MATQIKDAALGAVGAAGTIAYTAISGPPTYIWGLCGLVVAAALVGITLKKRWVEAKPN